MSSKITSSQTVGPYPHEGWRWGFEATATAPSAARTAVSGTIFDGDGRPIDDAVLEVWMPFAAGAEPDVAIPGFRRAAADAQGQFRLQLTAAPDRPAGEPVAYVTVFARGVLKHQFTALWLDDDPHLAASALLAQVPAERRATLVARKAAAHAYLWDIWLQTDRETVFFDYE